jgi:hypothetical protein
MDSNPQRPQPDDEWLLNPTTPTAQDPEPTEVLDTSAPVQATDVAPRQGRSQLLGAGGLVAAGLVVGAVGTFALGHHGSSTTTFQPAGNNVQQAPGGSFGAPPGMQSGTGQQGTVPQGGTTQQQQGSGTFQGGPMGGFGGPPGMGGGMAGEEHVQGTVAGVSGSTLRVTTSSGTKSYTVGSSTQVIRNGQAATLSQLASGDPVVVHVITSNGSTFVERVIAGTLTQGGPGGFAPSGTING